MNLIESFQDLVAQVSELFQPLIVAVAGAVPFIEGEGAAAIGIVGGIHPVPAVIAGIIGNFLCVAVLVLLSSRARDAVVTRHRKRVRVRETVISGDGSAGDFATNLTEEPAAVSQGTDGRTSGRKAKFQRAFERYGVPGVSLLGPLLLPTHFTATMLAAGGIGTARILLWQAIAIIGWTTAVAVIISGVVYAVS